MHGDICLNDLLANISLGCTRNSNMGLRCQELHSSSLDQDAEYPPGFGFEISFAGKTKIVFPITVNKKPGDVTASVTILPAFSCPDPEPASVIQTDVSDSRRSGDGIMWLCGWKGAKLDFKSIKNGLSTKN